MAAHSPDELVYIVLTDAQGIPISADVDLKTLPETQEILKGLISHRYSQSSLLKEDRDNPGAYYINPNSPAVPVSATEAQRKANEPTQFYLTCMEKPPEKAVFYLRVATEKGYVGDNPIITRMDLFVGPEQRQSRIMLNRAYKIHRAKALPKEQKQILSNIIYIAENNDCVFRLRNGALHQENLPAQLRKDTEILAYLSQKGLIPYKGTPIVQNQDLKEGLKAILESRIDNSDHRTEPKIETLVVYPDSTWTARKNNGMTPGVQPESMPVYLEADPASPTCGDLLIGTIPPKQQRGIEGLTCFMALQYITTKTGMKKVIGISMVYPGYGEVVLTPQELDDMTYVHDLQTALAEHMEEVFKQHFYVVSFANVDYDTATERFYLKMGATENSPQRVTFSTAVPASAAIVNISNRSSDAREDSIKDKHINFQEYSSADDLYLFEVHARAEKVRGKGGRLTHELKEIIACCREIGKSIAIPLDGKKSLQGAILLGMLQLAASANLSLEQQMVCQFNIWKKLLPQLISTTNRFLDEHQKPSSAQSAQMVFEIQAILGRLPKAALFDAQGVVQLSVINDLKTLLSYATSLLADGSFTEEMEQKILQPLQEQQQAKIQELSTVQCGTIDALTQGLKKFSDLIDAMLPPIENYTTEAARKEAYARHGEELDAYDRFRKIFNLLKGEIGACRINENTIINPQVIALVRALSQIKKIDPITTKALKVVLARLETQYEQDVKRELVLQLGTSAILSKSLGDVAVVMDNLCAQKKMSEKAQYHLTQFKALMHQPYNAVLVIKSELTDHLEFFCEEMEDEEISLAGMTILNQLRLERLKNVADAEKNGLHEPGKEWRFQIIAGLKALKKELDDFNKRVEDGNKTSFVNSTSGVLERMQQDEKQGQSSLERLISTLDEWSEMSLTLILHGETDKAKRLSELTAEILAKIRAFSAVSSSRLSGFTAYPDKKLSDKIESQCRAVEALVRTIPILGAGSVRSQSPGSSSGSSSHSPSSDFSAPSPVNISSVPFVANTPPSQSLDVSSSIPIPPLSGLAVAKPSSSPLPPSAPLVSTPRSSSPPPASALLASILPPFSSQPSDVPGHTPPDSSLSPLPKRDSNPNVVAPLQTGIPPAPDLSSDGSASLNLPQTGDVPPPPPPPSAAPTISRPAVKAEGSRAALFAAIQKPEKALKPRLVDYRLGLRLLKDKSTKIEASKDNPILIKYADGTFALVKKGEDNSIIPLESLSDSILAAFNALSFSEQTVVLTEVSRAVKEAVDLYSIGAAKSSGSANKPKSGPAGMIDQLGAALAQKRKGQLGESEISSKGYRLEIVARRPNAFGDDIFYFVASTGECFLLPISSKSDDDDDWEREPVSFTLGNEVELPEEVAQLKGVEPPKEGATPKEVKISAAATNALLTILLARAVELRYAIPRADSPIVPISTSPHSFHATSSSGGGKGEEALAKEKEKEEEKGEKTSSPHQSPHHSPLSFHSPKKEAQKEEVVGAGSSPSLSNSN